MSQTLLQKRITNLERKNGPMGYQSKLCRARICVTTPAKWPIRVCRLPLSRHPVATRDCSFLFPSWTKTNKLTEGRNADQIRESVLILHLTNEFMVALVSFEKSINDYVRKKKLIAFPRSAQYRELLSYEIYYG